MNETVGERKRRAYSYMKGWKDGAGIRGYEKQEYYESEYSEGYQDGRDAYKCAEIDAENKHCIKFTRIRACKEG